MVANTEIFQAAIDKFDAANAEDPNQEEVNGIPQPSAVIYAQRMTEWLNRFDPQASEELQLAARAQHIQRWKIKRSEFPEGVKGYNQWRRAVALFHADRAGEILRAVGYEETPVTRVEALLRREKRTSDAEVQQLEDIACLVFLEHYFSSFGEKFQYDDEKLADIVRKTWRKMSPKAHEAALTISLPEREQKVVALALSA